MLTDKRRTKFQRSVRGGYYTDVIMSYLFCLHLLKRKVDVIWFDALVSGQSLALLHVLHINQISNIWLQTKIWDWSQRMIMRPNTPPPRTNRHHHFICLIMQQYAHLHRYYFRRAGQQGPTRTPTAALKRAIKQLLGSGYIFYHTSKILQTRKLEKSAFPMLFLKKHLTM